LVGDGHGLKATVRMLADATWHGSGLEVLRTGVVEHEEGRDLELKSVGREEIADGKAVAHPVRGAGAVSSDEFFLRCGCGGHWLFLPVLLSVVCCFVWLLSAARPSERSRGRRSMRSPSGKSFRASSMASRWQAKARSMNSRP